MPELIQKLPVINTIKEAWVKIYCTGPIWTGFSLVFLLSALISIARATFSNSIFAIVFEVMIRCVNLILFAGIIYMAIQRVRDMPLNYKMTFYAFRSYLALKVIGLFIVYSMVSFITILFFAFICINNEDVSNACPAGVGLDFSSPLFFIFAFLVIPAVIFLGIRLMFSLYFIVDKDVGPIEAMLMSFTATRGNFWPIFGLLVFSMVVYLVCSLILPIGFLWGIPLLIVFFAPAYQKLMGHL